MNTLELEGFLRRMLPPRVYTGVFAENELPYKELTYPAAIIVNTQPSSQRGDHWVSVYLAKNEPAQFFDTRGQPPEPPVRRFIRIVSPRGLVYNERQVQSRYTDLCGAFCLDYLYHRHYSPNVSYQRLITELYPYKDRWRNDVTVHKRFERLFGVRLNVNKMK